MHRRVLAAFVVWASIGLGLPGTILAQVNTPPAAGEARPAAPRSEAGRPFLTSFAPSDYDAEAQNWAVIEDDRGIIYVGNSSGILEYDGETWRFFQLPNRSAVRSMARDEAGRIWVGGTGDLGYLAPDSLGAMTFVSIRNEVPEEYRDFADVWETFALPSGVGFNLTQLMLVWNGKSFEVFPAQDRFHTSAVVNGVFYVRQWGVGLMRMESGESGRSLRLVPGGEGFATTRIYAMLPYDEGRILIATREEGLFLYDGARFEPFATEADVLLAEGGIYLPGAVLPGGRFALGTLAAGLVVIDHEGRLVDHIDGDSGLQDDVVYYTFLDSAGDLWLAHDRGITRLQIGSAFTQFSSQTGIPSSINSLARYDGVLYATTASAGVIQLDAATGRFHTIRSDLTQTFELLDAGGQLLVAASNDGIVAVEGMRIRSIRPPVNRDYSTRTAQRLRNDPDRVLVGVETGLGVLRRDGSNWVDEGLLYPTDTGVDAIAQQEDGTLWLGTSLGRVIRIRAALSTGGRPNLDDVQVTVFGSAEGLSSGSQTPYLVRGEVYVSTTGEAVFRFDEESQRFEPDHTFDGARSGHPLGNFDFREDGPDRVWISSNYGPPVIADRQQDGTYSFTELRQFRHDRVVRTLPEADGVVWLMGSDRLIRYDMRLEGQLEAPPRPLIRRFSTGDGHLVYAGAGSPAETRLEPGSGAVRISYAAPGATGSHRYRTWLEGLDEDWTAWTSEREAVYTNLSPDTYRFRVEAEGQGEAEYVFTVLPPWYRTYWAYALYVLMLGFSVYGVDRLQRRRLFRQEREHAARREIELRAETAEAKSQAVEAEASLLKVENERKQNVELLSRIGQAITSTLSVGEVIDTVYEHVNALMDAAIFGIGIFNEAEGRIDFPATKEKGETLDVYSNKLTDESRLAVWCLTNRKEVLIGEFRNEVGNYVSTYQPPISGADPESVLYLPLVQSNRVIGVITTQSFARNAYGEHEVNLLRNLATYTAIALDNASAYRRLDTTVSELRTTQQQLVQQEKMASLGQLTSGIAHEIKNPLNFINNFAEVSTELTRELGEALARRDESEVKDLLDDLTSNARQIVRHGKRADRIVSSMMEHSREGDASHYDINLNKLVDEYVDLAYHGLQSRRPDVDVEVTRQLDPKVGSISLAPQEMGRVLVNLCSNAFDALIEHSQSAADEKFRPRLDVSTRRLDDRVELRISDNGGGIPAAIHEKIFEPFFTTKPTGSGTGLGLSLSYDIVTRGHGGSMTVESEEGGGATFIITLPADRRTS